MMDGYGPNDWSAEEPSVPMDLPSPFDQDDVTAGAEMNRIRRKAYLPAFPRGLSVNELADLLRVNDEATLRKMERGTRSITGPIRLVLEMLDDGRLDPNTELTASE